MKFKRVDPKRFEGKKFELASTDRIEKAGHFADDFMFEIFDFDAGDYLITDESALRDYTDFGSSDVEPLWTQIERRYGIDGSEVPSDKLVDIFETIIARENPQ